MNRINKYIEYKKKGYELMRKLGLENEDVINYFNKLEAYKKGKDGAILGMTVIYKKHMKA